VTVIFGDVMAGTFTATASLPTPVTTIRFDSRGLVRATSPGPMNRRVRSAPLVELWLGALDPVFITFAGFIILPYAAPGGDLTAPKQWTVGVSQVAGDSAYAFIGLSSPEPGNPTAIVVYSSYAGMIRIDSLRAHSMARSSSRDLEHDREFELKMRRWSWSGMSAARAALGHKIRPASNGG
jgi:hypothetical protein